jgi:hypothetical protein
LEIVSMSGISAHWRKATHAPQKLPLRRILFIKDVIWAESQLFPKLMRLAKLDVLDLQGELLLAAVSGDADATLRAIKRFHTVGAPDLVCFYARPTLAVGRRVQDHTIKVEMFHSPP